MPPAYSTSRHGLNLAAAPSNNRSFSQDILIPADFHEQQRRGIEHRLAAQPSHSRYPPTSALAHSHSSSTIDAYDQIGCHDDDNRFFSHRDTQQQHYHDESLIPGVGRGLRAQHSRNVAPPAAASSPASYTRRLYHHHDDVHYDSQPSTLAIPAKSPYRSRITTSSAAHHRSSPSAALPRPRPRPARVDTATCSADDDSISSATSSGDDGFESTGNHRAFAATPAGGTLTSHATQSLLQRRYARPVLGEDTLDRIDFDRYTDSDRASTASKKKLNEDDPTYANAYVSSNDRPQPARRQQHRPSSRPDPSQDPRDPFHSPLNAGAALAPSTAAIDVDRTRPTMMNHAAAYQQHLNSRTLTSPAIRTLVGDRTKSPDSPSPAPSISGRIFNRERTTSAGRGDGQPSNANARTKLGMLAKAGLERDPSHTAVSAFEDMARKLQRDVELTRRAEEVDEARRQDDDADTVNNSNSGGSGYGPGPGSQVSSARTRVENNGGAKVAANTSQESGHKRQGEVALGIKFNANGYPAYAPVATAAVAPEEPTLTAAYPAYLLPGAPGHFYTGSATRKARADDPFATRLPDLTGLTSALTSPLKARDGGSHIPIDPAVGSQFARLEELGHLRVFVDSLQTELDRAGERIVNLEESQEMQKEEVDGLRKEVHNVWQDVREVRGGDFIKTLMERIREEERQIHQEQARQQEAEQQQQQHPQQQPTREPPMTHQAAQQHQANGTADETSQTHVDADADVHSDTARPRAASPNRQGGAPMSKEARLMMSQDEHDEAVQRLYGELDKLKVAMAEQFRKATQLATSEERHAATNEARHFTESVERVAATAAVEKNRPCSRRWSGGDGVEEGSGYRDPWEAIEALRVQVVYLAGEVEKLNDVVVERFIEPRKATRQEHFFSATTTGAHNAKAAASASARARSAYVVHDNGLETDPETAHATRPRVVRDSYRFENGGGRGGVHPASDPAPFEAASRRTSTPPLPRHASTRPAPSQHQQRSRVSFGHGNGHDDMQAGRYSVRAGGGERCDPDETIDAVSENRRRRNQTAAQQQQAAPLSSDEEVDEEDVSMIAEARAQRAFESMSRRASRFASYAHAHAHDDDQDEDDMRHDVAAAAPNQLGHDPAHCTVCSSARRSARRQASRRTKALERERQHCRTSHAFEEDATMLDHLLEYDDVSLHLSRSQVKVLQKMLREEWDEFVHHRMLYSELADELKGMNPRMGREKRKILAQHVLDAVEMLEVKAERINRLEKVVEGSSLEEGGRKEREGKGLRDVLDAIPDAPRYSSTTQQREGGNVAKTRLTPKAQRKAMERLNGARNSPPTIDRAP